MEGNFLGLWQGWSLLASKLLAEDLRARGREDLALTPLLRIPPRPTAMVPVEEPTCLQAIPGSLSIHYNPGNTQEGPSIRKGGVNDTSL